MPLWHADTVRLAASECCLAFAYLNAKRCSTVRTCRTRAPGSPDPAMQSYICWPAHPLTDPRDDSLTHSSAPPPPFPCVHLRAGGRGLCRCLRAARLGLGRGVGLGGLSSREASAQGMGGLWGWVTVRVGMLPWTGQRVGRRSGATTDQGMARGLRAAELGVQMCLRGAAVGVQRWLRESPLHRTHRAPCFVRCFAYFPGICWLWVTVFQKRGVEAPVAIVHHRNSHHSLAWALSRSHGRRAHWGGGGGLQGR